MKAVIIDDEFNSRELLQNMLENYCQGVQVLGNAAKVSDGIALIQRVNPDLVFLDIEMPGGDGFAVLEAFPEPDFQVIFVTGFSTQDHQDLALASLAWLHKPVNLRELQQTLTQSGLLPSNTKPQLDWFQKKRKDTTDQATSELLLLSGSDYERIRFQDILYLEAHRAYAAFHLVNGKERLASFPLSHYEKILPGDMFFRTHKSILVNIGKVETYERGRGGNLTLEGGGQLPIAMRRKTDFVRMLQEPARRDRK